MSTSWSCFPAARQKKVDWEDLLKTPKDKISIEHIYPKSETEEWEPAFKTIREARARGVPQ